MSLRCRVGDKVVAYPWIGCGECAVPEGEAALPPTAHTRHQTRQRLWHARHRAAWPVPPAARGRATGARCDLHLLGITALSALKKTRSHLSADDHLVIIGAAGGGS
jgi:alcohol dehydrogenase/propanol-preferring alcohol dehydrogenase